MRSFIYPLDNPFVVIITLCLAFGALTWVASVPAKDPEPLPASEVLTNEKVGSITVLTSTPGGYNFQDQPLPIHWAMDGQRRENRLAEEEQKTLAEFWKTNTQANWQPFQQHYHRTIRATTNEVELGFRADGLVVWRVPPEAKQATP